MKNHRRQGFTLIELLTVIAIIGILAGLTATVLPRALERAKVTRVKNAMNEISRALVQHFADHNTYPARYGYFTGNGHVLQPYTVPLRIYGNQDLYDEFSESYRTNPNRDEPGLSLLEYSPIGEVNQATGQVTFPNPGNCPDNYFYTGANNPCYRDIGQVPAQLNSVPRPFVYIPVNSRQLAIANRYWVEGEDWYAEQWDPNDRNLSLIEFPAESYDKYVLISVGPAGSTAGILDLPVDNPGFLNNVPVPYHYHVMGLRAYWLATRDRDQNGQLDFDYEARRTGGGEIFELPDGTRGYGPLIFVSQ